MITPHDQATYLDLLQKYHDHLNAHLNSLGPLTDLINAIQQLRSAIQDTEQQILQEIPNEDYYNPTH